MEGYGRPLTHAEEQQRLVMYVLYALSAIIWGHEHDYFGFAEEGCRAIKHIGKLLG
jgi:hypothetical protein